MSRWTDLAARQEHTVNQVAGGMTAHRGVVVHIAEGSYEGTISWQKNPAAQVSSHFIVDLDGAICQMVDTADRAWCQAAGNDQWISIENAGHSGTPLTAAQVAACGRIVARAHTAYGIPLQVTTDPTNGAGLGHHSMGGAAWGGHFDCPGDPIIAQKPAILAAAQGNPPPTILGDRMIIVMAHEKGSNVDWIGDGVFRYQVPDAAHRANALVVMGLQGNPNPTSIEFNPGTLDALGPIVVSATGGVPTTASVAVTDAQMAQLAAAVIASHDVLTDADKPTIEAALRDVLHGA